MLNDSSSASNTSTIQLDILASGNSSTSDRTISNETMNIESSKTDDDSDDQVKWK